MRRERVAGDQGMVFAAARAFRAYSRSASSPASRGGVAGLAGVIREAAVLQATCLGGDTTECDRSVRAAVASWRNWP